MQPFQTIRWLIGVPEEKKTTLSNVIAGSEGIPKELCFGSMAFRVNSYIHTVGRREKEDV